MAKEPVFFTRRREWQNSEDAGTHRRRAKATPVKVKDYNDDDDFMSRRPVGKQLRRQLKSDHWWFR